MDLNKKSVSSVDRRRRNYVKRQKRNENVKQLRGIASAREEFLISQQITPEIFNEQEIYSKLVQKRFHINQQTPLLSLREFVAVKVLIANSPRELYVIKKSDEEANADFHSLLNKIYIENSFELVYCLKPGIICVVRSMNGWQRCRILKLHENETCDVFLIDTGIIERIVWYNLRQIDERLIDYPAMAIRCSMVGINSACPIERYSLAIHERFRHLINTERELYIFVNHSDVFSSHIFLYYKENINSDFICINAVFPDDVNNDDSSEELEHAANQVKLTSAYTPPTSPPIQFNAPIRQSTPADFYIDVPTPTLQCKSPNMNGPTDTLPEPVIVRHVNSLDEIYVCFVRYIEIFKNLHYEIQMHVENIHLGSSFNLADGIFRKKIHDWNVKDHCLVIDLAEKQDEWFRGKITKIKTDGNCMVYLRDFGKVIESKLNHLEIIPEKMRIVRDFTWKIKMAAITPTNGCSNEVTKEVLQDLIPMNEKFAISAFSDAEKNDHGVILWRIHTVKPALMPDHTEYVNINKELVKHGVAIANISFDEIGKSFNFTQREGAKSNQNEENDYHEINFNDSDELIVTGQQGSGKISDKMEEVKTWLPSQPIKNKKFVAFPMYIGQNLAITVLEAARKDTAEEIKQILQEKRMANELQEKNAVEWRVDDACFAQFKGDGRYYRATIRRVNFAKNYCMVRFIDYGNCERVELDCLKKATMFGSIPVLTRMYKLHGIEPATGNGHWGEDARHLCSEMIMEKHCDLEVIEEKIKVDDRMMYEEYDTCRLGLLNKYKDLASVLIKCGYASTPSIKLTATNVPQNSFIVNNFNKLHFELILEI